MNKVDRYKILIRYCKEQGIAKSQKELGFLLGYQNESSFSQVINGKVDEPKDFITRLKNLVEDLNVDWLLTGEGTMLKMELSSERPVELNSHEEMIEKLKEANENLERYKQLTKQQSTTIDNQQKLIEMLQKQIERIEKQTGGNADEDKQG